ncbi:MAG TPA: hypothetical protein PL041_06535, partial [Melioribacteraceae bacterium]|nr:hypothetical protein [Melioribacteraceae bacterium]
MRNVLLILVFLSAPFFAQQPGSVINYSSMKDINNIYIKNNILYSASTGGIFSFNLTDSTYFALNKASGLSSQTNTAIGVDNQNKIWIGSSEGIIDVYNPLTGSINKILDIFNSDKTKKQINDITISGDTVFVATDFGLSLINSKTLAFIETVIKFGSFNSETKVSNVIRDKLIYVNTSLGIAVQKQNATNLSSPESWNTYTFPSSFGVTSINRITVNNNKVLIATNKGIFTIQNNAIVQYDLVGFNLIDVKIAENGIWALGAYDLIYNGTDGYFVKYHSDGPIYKRLIQVGSDEFYISTSAGVLHAKNNTTRFIFPSGPATNSFQYLGVENSGKIWSATGRDGFGIGIMHYDGLNWKLFNSINTPAISSNDFYKVSVASDNTVYGLSWGNGFTAFKGDKINTFNTNNTGMIGIPKTPTFLVIADIKKDNINNTWILNYWPGNKKPFSVLTTDSTWYHYDFIPFPISAEATFGS